MKLEPKAGQRGFTLIEILIVLAILAILAAVVIPNIQGFLTRGGRSAYDLDQRTIQVAVTAYYGDPDVTIDSETGPGLYPTTDGDPGTILIDDELDPAGYLTECPRSASDANWEDNGGTYTWMVDSDVKVYSSPVWTDTYP